MKQILFLLLFTIFAGCSEDCIEDYQEPEQPEKCNCYKGVYFVAGPNTGYIAQGKKEFYSNNCNDEGLTFRDDSLLYTMRLMIKCN